MGEALKYYVYLFQTLVAHVCLKLNWNERIQIEWYLLESIAQFFHVIGHKKKRGNSIQFYIRTGRNVDLLIQI